jgi:mRNA-degrading endonuclease RelE of RelBE toxin-antitoxin system
MNFSFLIANTFTDSIAKLTGDEQKAVKTTVFDLHLNLANPGNSFHKIDKAKDKNFWSVRASGDLRLIIHKSDASLLLCYVGHHEKAYEWAEHRRLETHPKTGAAQLVEIRETVKEIIVPVFVQKETDNGPKQDVTEQTLFQEISDDVLLGYGVPANWLDEVRRTTEETLLELADHLPAEAAEALLELATGGKPNINESVIMAANPFEHPDAMRRFRIVANVEELQRALDFPWEKWTVFLHPEQRQWVERDYSGPARVSGSAGTGKTIVALHRAVHLARSNPNSRVLLTTFSDTLANALQTKLKRLLSGEPSLSERIDVHSLSSIGLRLYKSHIGLATIASTEILHELMVKAASSVESHKFSQHFLFTEWEQVVDAWQVENWEDYRQVARLGRKTRISEPQRAVLWSIFDRVHIELKERKLITFAELFSSLAKVIAKNQNIVFDYVVIDEAQDLSIAHLRFLASLGGNRSNALFFAGDLGQRIFQQPFSWKAIGVDIRGRSRTLHVNYRTSHQIRSQADRLLGPVVTDVDGNSEDRKDTVSVFNGPAPKILSVNSEDEEIKMVAKWLVERASDGVLPHEFGVFVRSAAQIDRAKLAVMETGMAFKLLDEHVETTNGYVSICTMHLAKGLEFRAVAVMACDDEVIPLQERIETVGDDADLQEVYDTERQLLYVACTRARDYLLVTSVKPASEFLDDMVV